MYKSKGVEFLIDPLDTVQEYEEAGKVRREKYGSSQYERGLQALSEMDRIRQVEAIQRKYLYYLCNIYLSNLEMFKT